MIESRARNQKIVINHIESFVIKYGIGHELMLLDFTRELATLLLKRTSDADCYIIDMLEDIEHIGEN